MATMGRYCKAYYVRQLREYSAWRPNLEQLRPETTEVDGQDVQSLRSDLKDDDILYLQESSVVTDGIFLDEYVVFDAVTPEWQEFCRSSLAFEVPADLTDDSIPAETANSAVSLETEIPMNGPPLA